MNNSQLYKEGRDAAGPRNHILLFVADCRARLQQHAGWNTEHSVGHFHRGRLHPPFEENMVGYPRRILI